MDRTPAPLLRDVIGRLLRVRRIARGLTLADVAARAGISTQYLSEVERGLKDASSEMVAAIAGALGMQLHEVLVLSSRLVAPVDDGRVRAVTGEVPTTLPLSSPLTSTPSLASAPSSSPMRSSPMRGDVVLAA